MNKSITSIMLIAFLGFQTALTASEQIVLSQNFDGHDFPASQIESYPYYTGMPNTSGGSWLASFGPDDTDALPSISGEQYRSAPHALRITRGKPRSAHTLGWTEIAAAGSNKTAEITIWFRREKDAGFTFFTCQREVNYAAGAPGIYLQDDDHNNAKGDYAKLYYYGPKKDKNTFGWVRTSANKIKADVWYGLRFTVETNGKTTIFLNRGESWENIASEIPLNRKTIGYIQSLRFAPDGKYGTSTYLDDITIKTVDNKQPPFDTKTKNERLLREARQKLAAAPTPWKSKPPYPSATEYNALVKYWSEKYSDRCHLEKRGTSVDGQPIWMLKITDFSRPDDNKQVILFTGLHCGGELSGATALMHLTDWLLSNDAEAVETRRKQIVLMMPIVNPDGFFAGAGNANRNHIDTYNSRMGKIWDLKTLTIKPEWRDKVPEILTVKGVVDEYQPEVWADTHGTALRHAGIIQPELSATTGSNYTLKPWDWRITEEIIHAGEKAGFGSNRAEADNQRLLWGDRLDEIKDRLSYGRGYFYTAHYAYAAYHTMIMTEEIAWEASGVARWRGLLRIGNKIWGDVATAGYPVNVIRTVSEHHVMAWGKTAAQRRASRVELWQKQAGFSTGSIYDMTDTRTMVVLTTTERARKIMHPKFYRFLENLHDEPRFNVPAIRAFIEAGPEVKLYNNDYLPGSGTKPNSENLQNGVAIRLRFPYRKLDIVDLRLNGNILSESDTDGYRQWFAEGYTQIHISIPPSKSKKHDLFIVTCAFKPAETRTHGYQIPEEVRIKAKQ